MARPQSAGFEGQREQILSAAARLFATRGYSAATMNEVAAASGISKATLYHYVRDKHDLLAQISNGHVVRLQALVGAVDSAGLSGAQRLDELIRRFMQAYAHAEHEHRVLTEDVKFLEAGARDEVLGAQRRVVKAFADAIVQMRPELARSGLETPLAMLLFGMMNWTFTWLKPGGALTHATLAEVIVQLFGGGVSQLQLSGLPRPAVG